MRRWLSTREIIFADGPAQVNTFLSMTQLTANNFNYGWVFTKKFFVNDSVIGKKNKILNISLKIYKKLIFCFSPQVTYPDWVAQCKYSNSVTNISRLGTFNIIYEQEWPFMHLTDCCWFLISSGCVSVMGGWVGNAVRKHFCPVKFSPPPIRPPRFSPSDSSPSPPHLGPAILQLEDSRVHKTTYAPMIYTALRVSFLMGAGR